MKATKFGILATTQTSAEPPYVEMVWTSIGIELNNVNSWIGGDATDVAVWNTFFVDGNFTSVEITGDGPYTIILHGGSNLILRGDAFVNCEGIESFIDTGVFTSSATT